MKAMLLHKPFLTVADICDGFVYNEHEGKGLFGWGGKLTIQPEYQRNYIYADGKKDVAVVGGGDTACEEANYLATLCNKVYLIHRRNELRASKSMQHRVLTNPKIEMIWDSTTKEICGNDLDGVTGADLQNVKTGEIRHIDIAGFFVAIGHKPNTDFVKGQVELDEQGYIKVQNPGSATNIPGVFAAGDVCDPNYRQAIVAAGKGCIAAMDVERFLQSQN